MASSTADSLRAFVAIAIETALLTELKKLQLQLQAGLRGEAARWTRAGQLHLTLKFLGNVNTAALPELIAALNRAAAGHPPFQLSLEGLGCFPDTGKPRIVWIGFNGEVDALMRLQTDIEKELHGFGDHSEERTFQPHLTIGRVKAAGREARRVGERVENTRVASLGTWTVCQVDLIQSELLSQGARYTQLATARLTSGKMRE